jgi:signal transduction histidine kinase
MGLYIAHQIVQAHGGTLYVESKLGFGSTFIVTLPNEPESPAK